MHLVFLGPNGNISEKNKGFNLMLETVLTVDTGIPKTKLQLQAPSECIHGLELAAGRARGGQLRRAGLRPANSSVQPHFTVRPQALRRARWLAVLLDTLA